MNANTAAKANMPGSYRYRLSKHSSSSSRLKELKEKLNRTTQKLLGGMQDYEYFVELQVGTPPRAVLAQVDTGSTDLWIYDNQSSSTQTVIDKEIHKEGFGDSSFVSGDIVQDKVSLCGTLKATFGNIENTSGNSFEPNGVGIMGMAYRYLSDLDGSPSLFEQMVDQGLIEDIFSIDLNSMQLTFGEAEPGEYQYTPINNSAGYYGIDVSKTEVAGKVIALRIPPETPNIVDSGAALMYVPEALYQAVVTQVNPNQVYANEMEITGPDIDLYLKGVGQSAADIKLNLSANDYYYQRSDGQYYFGLAPQPGFILGDVFLKNFVVVFDRKNGRLGFSKNAS